MNDDTSDTHSRISRSSAEKAPSREEQSLDAALIAHLADWGLKHFVSDEAYFAWQRQSMDPSDLARLHECLAAKQAPNAGVQEETAFYDVTASPPLVPALYSQRYEYYAAVGVRVAARIAPARRILDFGCGIGILTTFYARQHPMVQVTGVDRSSASIDHARRRAAAMNLSNVDFLAADVDGEELTGTYDLIIATHALLQTERELGLPSDRWDTFDRTPDLSSQARFEARTGLALRLDRLVRALSDEGRMLVFEKSRLLARRVPFQRALAARGLHLLEEPEPVRYALVEDVADDGPFMVLGRGRTEPTLRWNERPEDESASPIHLPTLKQRTMTGDEPLYENHTAAAQRLWEGLSGRRVLQECSRQGADGRALHAELGTVEGLLYLYVANTFDQRQLVLIEPARAQVLEAYYAEIERS